MPEVRYCLFANSSLKGPFIDSWNFSLLCHVHHPCASLCLWLGVHCTTDNPFVWALGQLECEARIEVYWTAESEWFSGRVMVHRESGPSKGTKIRYDDGETHVHDMKDEIWRLEASASSHAFPALGDAVRLWWRAHGQFVAGRVVRLHKGRQASVRYHQTYLPSDSELLAAASASPDATTEVRHDFDHENFEIMSPRDKLGRELRSLPEMRLPEKHSASKFANVHLKKAVDSASQNETGAANAAISKPKASRRRSRSTLPAEQMRSLLDEVFSRALLCSKHTLRCLAVPVNRAQFPDYFEKVQHPMDLRTMREQLRRAKEHDLSREGLLKLLTLMVDNSCIYNGPDHFVTQSAEELRKIGREFMYGEEHGPAFEEVQRAMEEASAVGVKRLLQALVVRFNKGDHDLLRFRRLPRPVTANAVIPSSAASVLSSTASAGALDATKRGNDAFPIGEESDVATSEHASAVGAVRIGTAGGKQFIIHAAAAGGKSMHLVSVAASGPQARAEDVESAESDAQPRASTERPRDMKTSKAPLRTRRGRVARPTKRFDPTEEANKPQWGGAAAAPSKSSSSSNASGSEAPVGVSENRSKSVKPGASKAQKAESVSTAKSQKARQAVDSTASGVKVEESGPAAEDAAPPRARPRLTFRMRVFSTASDGKKTTGNGKVTKSPSISSSATSSSLSTPSNKADNTAVPAAELLKEMQQRTAALHAANLAAQRSRGDDDSDNDETDDRVHSDDELGDDEGAGGNGDVDEEEEDDDDDDDDPISRHLDTVGGDVSVSADNLDDQSVGVGATSDNSADEGTQSESDAALRSNARLLARHRRPVGRRVASDDARRMFNIDGFDSATSGAEFKSDDEDGKRQHGASHSASAQPVPLVRSLSDGALDEAAAAADSMSAMTTPKAAGRGSKISLSGATRADGEDDDAVLDAEAETAFLDLGTLEDSAKFDFLERANTPTGLSHRARVGDISVDPAASNFNSSASTSEAAENLSKAPPVPQNTPTAEAFSLDRNVMDQIKFADALGLGGMSDQEGHRRLGSFGISDDDDGTDAASGLDDPDDNAGSIAGSHVSASVDGSQVDTASALDTPNKRIATQQDRSADRKRPAPTSSGIVEPTMKQSTLDRAEGRSTATPAKDLASTPKVITNPSLKTLAGELVATATTGDRVNLLHRLSRERLAAWVKSTGSLSRKEAGSRCSSIGVDFVADDVANIGTGGCAGSSAASMVSIGFSSVQVGSALSVDSSPAAGATQEAGVSLAKMLSKSPNRAGRALRGAAGTQLGAGGSQGSNAENSTSAMRLADLVADRNFQRQLEGTSSSLLGGMSDLSDRD